MTEGDQLPPEWVAPGQKLVALSRFHAGIAHDLNNRLTTVLGYLCVVDELLPGEREMLADLHHAANEAAELVRLLQIFQNRDSLPAGPVDLGRVLTRLQDLLGRLVHTRGAIPLLLPDEDLYICGEEGAVEQVLVHILGESLDAPPSLISLRGENGRVCLCIQGISVPHLPPAAEELLKLLEGQWKSTREGCELSFPKLELETQEQPPLPPLPAGRSVLLADGAPHLCTQLAGFLTRAGFEVVTAANVTDLTAKLIAARFDAAVLDTRLPGGGLSALSNLRDLPENVVWMEPYPGADRLPRDRCIPKPFRPADLIRRLS